MWDDRAATDSEFAQQVVDQKFGNEIFSVLSRGKSVGNEITSYN
ncbi:hypothetical protein SAMN05216308_101743 [Nitrosospira sp. Nsp13]|jgi:hypothetical protein|nr:hypothetical protein SAMN05216308_101743 [Nitrosospira sp. Nsp13]